MTPIYKKIMQLAEAGETCASPALQHRVWDPTPWVIDVYVGEMHPITGHREDERPIRQWLDEHVGKESRPLHERPGAWYHGGATVYGWTWIGFDTEDHMNAFLAAWPDNAKAPNPQNQGGGE